MPDAAPDRTKYSHNNRQNSTATLSLNVDVTDIQVTCSDACDTHRCTVYTQQKS